ncbi:CLUMA_CG009534, isoform A, partial [Clunio marinus]
MNPLTNMKNVQKLSEQELRSGNKTSWHDQYRNSAWIFVGGLPYDLSEEIKKSGKQKGFCFICYEDQRSTILAVDNLNGIKLLGKTLRVDHVSDYKPPKDHEDYDDITRNLHNQGCAPVPQISESEIKKEKHRNLLLQMEDEKPDVGENLLAAKVDDEAIEKTSQATSENITYDESGETIFTDPTTKYKYKWNKEANEWKPVENEHYKWCNESQKWIPKASTENEFYRWCDKTNQWIPKMSGKEGITYGYDEKEGCHTYTDKDGAVFFFDNEKKAWFPKVDDDFLAMYQLNYGFIDNTSKEDDKVVKSNVETSEVSTSEAASTTNLDEQPQTSNEAKKRKAPPAPPKWFELPPEQNTKVYVSNLPLDITEEEFSELMGKCGMVMKDLKTGKLKMKLYRDSNGQLKGDGLCHYIK